MAEFGPDRRGRFAALPHPPIEINDFVGSLLEKYEGMDHATGAQVAAILNELRRDAMALSPLSKARMLSLRLSWISFHSVEATQFVGMIALCIILFTGGMDTKFSEIRPVIGPGIVLATAGVVMTAVIVAGFVTLIAPWVGLAVSFPAALLLAATMSSTDSASVFSILRSKKQGLNENLRPLLELESGSNDPMAYMMTILLISVVSNTSSGVGLGMSVVFFVVQMVVGALSGYLIGRLAVWTINRIKLANHSLYSVLLLAFIFFSFAFTDLIKSLGRSRRIPADKTFRQISGIAVLPCKGMF